VESTPRERILQLTVKILPRRGFKAIELRNTADFLSKMIGIGGESSLLSDVKSGQFVPCQMPTQQSSQSMMRILLAGSNGLESSLRSRDARGGTWLVTQREMREAGAVLKISKRILGFRPGSAAEACGL
jgi:hypothetical protein